MQGKNKFLLTLLIVVNVFTILVLFYFVYNQNNEKTAYFLSAEVYNEFDYKKELEHELDLSEQKHKETLDSLELDYKMFISNYQSNELTDDEIIILKRKQNYFLELKQEFENQYSQTVNTSYNLIWNRINEYVKSYGQEHGYTYIFGANGDGSVMYADEAKNITNEIKDYINIKYSGN